MYLYAQRLRKKGKVTGSREEKEINAKDTSRTKVTDF